MQYQIRELETLNGKKFIPEYKEEDGKYKEPWRIISGNFSSLEEARKAIDDFIRRQPISEKIHKYIIPNKNSPQQLLD